MSTFDIDGVTENLKRVRAREALQPANFDRVADALPRDELGLDARLQLFSQNIEALTQRESVATAAMEVATNLSQWFSPAPQPNAEGPDRPYPMSDLLKQSYAEEPIFTGHAVQDDAEVVVWRYTAIHDRPIDFGDDANVIHATNRVITFDGVSITTRDATGNEVVTKFIDWNFVMAQLGVYMSNRPITGGNADRDGVISTG